MIGRLRRWLTRPSVGRRGERVAARFLQRHGYRILARNVRNRFGEIDLVAQRRNDDRTVIFVEVKAGVPGPLPPEVHVTRDKQRKIAALSAQILRARRLTHARVRYDVIAVVLPPDGEPVIRHYPSAFESHV